MAAVTCVDPNDHLGRTILPANQLTILFTESCLMDCERLESPAAARGSGVHLSLASYLSGQLSRRMRSSEFPNIEGCFLSNLHLGLIEFDDDGETVASQTTKIQHDLSMFREEAEPAIEQLGTQAYVTLVHELSR